MNPLENEIRETLRRREPPEGFADRVMSRAGGLISAQTSRPAANRLRRPLIVIAASVIIAAAVGFYLTNCASACSIGGALSEIDKHPEANLLPAVTAHSRGPDKSEIVLEEDGDYECPACSTYFPIVEQVLRQFPNQIRFEFHHFPLTQIHSNAMSAAMAAEAAGDQNHFWEMHEILFQRQKEWAKSPDPSPIFASYAAQIGLNLDQFNHSLQSEANKDRVLKDIERAEAAHVDGTPTFFINGQKIPLPATVDEFAALIQSRLTGK